MLFRDTDRAEPIRSAIEHEQQHKMRPYICVCIQLEANSRFFILFLDIEEKCNIHKYINLLFPSVLHSFMRRKPVLMMIGVVTIKLSN